MKVLCIKDSVGKGLSKDGELLDAPEVKFGEIYTVVDVVNSWKFPGTKSYRLAEFEWYNCFNERYFSPLSNIDEKDFIREDINISSL